MSNVPVPWYYGQMSITDRSYVDYMGDMHKSQVSALERNTKAAEEIKSTLISEGIASRNALYNNMQQIDGTLQAGFSSVSMHLQTGLSGVSREIGEMGANMSMGLAFLNSAVQESSKAICAKLDEINDTLKNPLFTGFRELFNRALQNYNKELYEEALEDLVEAIKKNKTDPFSHFLTGQIYLSGISEFCNVIDLNAAIEALRNAAKYITPDAKTTPEARLMAAEIWYYVGLAHHNKANDELHHKNQAEYEKQLEEAKTAYGRSWDYSQKMLESLYCRARCKTRSNDHDGAIQDLMEVVLKDNIYCIKISTEGDFDAEFKTKFFAHLKGQLYPELKTTFDSIVGLKTEFSGPYSDKLTKLMEKHLPNSFTEDIPSFDMLKANSDFMEIIAVLKEEQRDHISRCREYERIEEEKRKELKGIEERNSVLKEARKKASIFKNCISGTCHHVVGLKTNGTVVAVGNNKFGQCNVEDWRGIVAVYASEGITVGLKANGTVVAVGNNKFGQCNTEDWRNIIAIYAEGSYTSGSDKNRKPIYDINGSHTVGLKTDGTIVVTGKDSYRRNSNEWRDILANNAACIESGECDKEILMSSGNLNVRLKTDGTVVTVSNNKHVSCNTENWQDIIAISVGTCHVVGLGKDGTVSLEYGGNYVTLEPWNWRDIVAVLAPESTVIGLKSNGTVVVTGYDGYDLSSVNWNNIGPVPEEQLQSMRWQAQGLCQYCGGEMGGVFSKKCKACGK